MLNIAYSHGAERAISEAFEKIALNPIQTALLGAASGGALGSTGMYTDPYSTDPNIGPVRGMLYGAGAGLGLKSGMSLSKLLNKRRALGGGLGATFGYGLAREQAKSYPLPEITTPAVYWGA